MLGPLTLIVFSRIITCSLAIILNLYRFNLQTLKLKNTEIFNLISQYFCNLILFLVSGHIGLREIRVFLVLNMGNDKSF